MMKGLLKSRGMTGAGVILLGGCFLFSLLLVLPATGPDAVFCPRDDEFRTNEGYMIGGTHPAGSGALQVSLVDSHDLFPPWEIYGWEKEVKVWGGHSGWGAKSQNITWCEATPERGYGHVESRAFGLKCQVTLWFGHLTQWICPKTGRYTVTFSYFYSDGISEAYYTLHPEFSGELETSATLIFFYGPESHEQRVFTKWGKHTPEYFQNNTTETFEMPCIQGERYILGANFSLMAYTDSWDEAWSSSQIEARGMLTQITLERKNTPPDTPSRPIGPGQGVTGREYLYQCSAVDPDGDDVGYLFEWGDGTMSGWQGPYPSGTMGNASHIYHQGNYSIRVKARDEMGAESPWSEPLSVSMPLWCTAPIDRMSLLWTHCVSFLVHWIPRILFIL